MYNPIKKLIGLIKTNKKLKDALLKKTQEAQGYKDTCFSLLENSTAEIVVGKVLNRSLKWFDYTALPNDEREAYYKEAQSILRSKVFTNEWTSVIMDLVEEIAKRSKDFDHVLTLRAKIVMAELLRERLEKITPPPPPGPKEPKEPNSSI